MANARWHLDMPDLSALGSPPTSHDAIGQPMIRWQPLGAAVVRVGAARIDPASELTFALLLRLSFAPGARLARERLLAELWPGLPDARQRGNLRQALYKLRGFGVRVEIRGDEVALNPAQIVPVFALERTSQRFEEDVTRGHEPFGAFLPGYASSWPALDEWVRTTRDAVHADIRRVLVEQLRMRRDRVDWTGAHALAKWLLQFDPLNEDATLTHAECTMMNGSKAEAVAILDAYIADLGPSAGDIRLPATQLRRRITEAKPLARRNLAPTERHFMGREALMGELTATMRRAKWRDGSVTLLHGPPGMGKTRVLQELAKVAAIEGFQVISVACREADQPRSLAVFLDVVTELLELPGAAGCEPATMRVLHRFARTPSSAASALDESAALLADDPSYLPTPAALRRAIVDLLKAVCFEMPVCLQVDDVHWIDSESGKLIGELCAATDHRVFTLLCSRVETMGWLSNTERRGVTLRQLSPIREDSAIALTEAIAADVALTMSPAAHQWIVETSEGNPLYLRSLLSHWIETGVTGGVPPTLVQLIDSRLSALSSDALHVMQAIGLLGKRAALSSLTQVLDISSQSLMSALDEISANFSIRLDGEGHASLHDLIQRSALRRMSVASSHLLNLRVANYLTEFVAPTDETAVLEIISRLGESRLLSRLASQARTSALELTAKGRPYLAVAVCDEARRFLDQSQFERILRTAHVQAILLSGGHARLVSEYPTLTSTEVDESLTDDQANELLSAIDSSRYSVERGDYVDFTARAVLIAESPVVSDEVRFRAACVALRTSSFSQDSALPTRAHSAGMLRIGSLDHPEARQCELDMYYHTFFGDSHRALRAALQLAADPISYARSEGDKLLILGNVVYALRINGAIDEAFQLCISVAERAEQCELFGLASSCWRNASSHLMDAQFTPHEAERCIDRALRLAQHVRSPYLTWIALENAVKLAVLLDNPQRVDELLGQLLALNYGSRVPVRQSARAALILAAAVIRQESESVHSQLTRACELYEIVQGQPGQSFFAYALGRAHLLVGDKEHAIQVLDRHINRRGRPEPTPWYIHQLRRMAMSS